MSGRETSEPDLSEEQDSKNGKICRFCKRINPRDTHVCLFCGKRPITWRPEFRTLIWLIVIIAISAVIFIAWQIDNAPLPGARTTQNTPP